MYGGPCLRECVCVCRMLFLRRYPCMSLEDSSSRCLPLCVRVRPDPRYSYTLSAVLLCSLYDSIPAVSALETSGGRRGTDINNAINPCGYVPYTPLLMTTATPLWHAAWVQNSRQRELPHTDARCVCVRLVTSAWLQGLKMACLVEIFNGVFFYNYSWISLFCFVRKGDN